MRDVTLFGFEDFFDALGDETVILDENGTILAANLAWQKSCAENGGDSRTSYVGTNYFSVCRSAKGTSSAEANLVLEGLRDVLMHGTPFRCEYPCDSPTTKRWFELTATRMVQGGVKHLIVQHRNITARHVESEDSENAFMQSELMSALVATTNDAVLSYDLDGKIITWNRAAENLYGYTPEEALGQSLELLYPADWPHSVIYYRDQIIAGKLTSFEATRIAKDGSERLVWITCAPVRGSSGGIIAVSNIHRDISDLRKAEEAREIISQEVIHRAKNMLTIVAAIQRQTGESAKSFQDFNDNFSRRLQSLLASTDLLVSSGWTTVSLAELVETQLDPFLSGDQAVIKIDGPAVILRPETVQAVGMAIHELATNSAKYGAIRQHDGKIEIFWTLDDNSTLKLTWHETDIKCDTQNAGHGFGYTVLTRLASSMLNADVEYKIEPSSVLWILTADSQNI